MIFPAIELGQSHTASPKAQALRALNDDTTAIQKALNQAQSAIAHALRTIENDYQRRRKSIIDSDDYLDQQP